MISLPTSARQWLQGIAVATIGGAASSGSAWLSLSTAHTLGADVPILNFKALGLVMLGSAIINLLTYLAKSPIPMSMESTTVTVTKETSGTQPERK